MAIQIARKPRAKAIRTSIAGFGLCVRCGCLDRDVFAFDDFEPPRRELLLLREPLLRLVPPPDREERRAEEPEPELLDREVEVGVRVAMLEP
ncbi:MAG: hypothetical protein WBB44_07880 [Candidatus Nanopelagicales bacterium]